jgi:heme-degrading monooxygenase HmoA
MYSRITLLEIDTVRIGVDEAVELFKTEVLPKLREQEGYEGVAVLATPEGKGMIVTVWETEEEAADAAGFASAALERYMALFRSPPGREYYEIAFAELPGVTVG